MAASSNCAAWALILVISLGRLRRPRTAMMATCSPTRIASSTRSQLSRFRGREVGTAGDGFLAMFDGPQRVIRCAMSIRDAVQALGTSRAESPPGQCDTAPLRMRGDQPSRQRSRSVLVADVTTRGRRSTRSSGSPWPTSLSRMRASWAARPSPVRSPDVKVEAILRARKLRRLCVALHERSAVHGPECPVFPVQKCLPECVSILSHLDSRA